MQATSILSARDSQLQSTQAHAVSVCVEHPMASAQSTPVEPSAPGPYTLTSVPMSRGVGRANHCTVHIVKCNGQFVRSFASKRVAERFVRQHNAQVAR